MINFFYIHKNRSEGFTQHYFHLITINMFAKLKTAEKHKHKSRLFSENGAGFSLLEILVSLALFSMILLAVISFFLSMNNSNLKSKSSGDVTENARRALEAITHEIRSAKSIYTPTTAASQLSLETTKYLPEGESITYIDFFLCGPSHSAICLKKEFHNPIAITPDSVKVTNLTFLQISAGASPSVQLNLTVDSNSGENSSLINLTSTAATRNY